MLVDALAAVVGCNRGTPVGITATDATAEGQRAWTIGMSQCNLGEPWRVQMNADVRAAADQHPDVQVIFKDAQNDTLRQWAHVEEFVSAGVDLLIVSPKEAVPLAEPIALAYRSGIPVIVLDRAVRGDEYTTFIGADNVQIGRVAGEWIASQIDVVYAHNDPGAHGAYLAARAAGREKVILFVGIDALPQEGVAYVNRGILDATFEYPTGGREAIEVACKILAGESVPKTITLTSRIFTKDNVAQGGEEIH